MISAKEIRCVLAMREMSVQTLSHKTGIPPTTLRRKLNGGSQFYAQEIQKICDCLDISITDSVLIGSKTTGG